MPKGCFVVLLPLDSDYRVLGYYFKDSSLDFEVSNNLFLRLNLDHERNEYNLLKLQEFRLFSYVHKFKGKLKRKANGLIIGILLEEEEKPERYRSSLKEASESLEKIDVINLTKEEFKSALKRIYQENLEPLVDALDPESIRSYIINRTKSMLSGGKKERKLAQELLEGIEDKDHSKISELYKLGKKAYQSSDFDKAAKYYSKSAEIAEELMGDESELTKSLKERANFAQKVPELSKEREKVVQNARDSLRNENFHAAYTLYRKASELSKELVQFDKEEEYRLKSNALKDFYNVDQRYKK
ncbi:MAG: hypothetical protein EU550_01530 [Promethearchaeota archaeon]|nr:MAG: hypothetical protein EU550_01530 [Candidatus Lokiarchaeota archaeon]